MFDALLVEVGTLDTRLLWHRLSVPFAGCSRWSSTTSCRSSSARSTGSRLSHAPCWRGQRFAFRAMRREPRRRAPIRACRVRGSAPAVATTRDPRRRRCASSVAANLKRIARLDKNEIEEFDEAHEKITALQRQSSTRRGFETDSYFRLAALGVLQLAELSVSDLAALRRTVPELLERGVDVAVLFGGAVLLSGGRARAEPPSIARSQGRAVAEPRDVQTPSAVRSYDPLGSFSGSR